MSRSRRLAVAATLVVVAAAAAMALRGGEASGPQLDALRADPLGGYAPGGAEPSAERTTAEDTTLGKPRPARYSRWFSLSRKQAERAFEDAVAAAEAAGWQPQRNRDGRTAVGAKQIADGAASAVVALLDEGAVLPQGVSAPALQIVLQR